MAIAGRDGFYLVEQRFEFLWIEFPVEIEAEKVIGEGHLRAHLQLLGERVGGLGLVFAQRVIQQGA